jgi:ribosome-associated protein
MKNKSNADGRSQLAGESSTGIRQQAGSCTQTMEFQLRGEFIELNQLLKLTGVCDSGGAGKALVAEGVVSVDGKVELRKTAKIRAGQVVTLGEVQIHVQMS